MSRGREEQTNELHNLISDAIPVSQTIFPDGWETGSTHVHAGHRSQQEYSRVRATLISLALAFFFSPLFFQSIAGERAQTCRSHN